MSLQLHLASTSPRRRDLLDQLGWSFGLLDPGVEELSEGDPERVVVANARTKAEAGLAMLGEPGGPVAVIGADTEVAIDGRPIGKAADADQARAHLELLSGREHMVCGGVAVLVSGPESSGSPQLRSGVELTRVRFRELSPAEIDAYVGSGEWQGKAGAYAVQGLGSMLVDRVEGEMSNVIGLSIPLVMGLLPELG